MNRGLALKNAERRIERRRRGLIMGERLRARRQELGLSRRELAERTGRDARRIAEFERSGVGTIQLAEELAQALEMDPCLLAFGADSVLKSND
jgi:transcriptional regulator with XRE-family HTH domain